MWRTAHELKEELINATCSYMDVDEYISNVNPQVADENKVNQQVADENFYRKLNE